MPQPFRRGRGSIADWSFWLTQQGFLEEHDQPRGKGSFPAMITPAYQNAKKANELASDVSTASGRPTAPQKQRRSETWSAVLPETYTRISFLELSQSRMLALNFYPDFWYLLLLFRPFGHSYLLQSRLEWTNNLWHLAQLKQVQILVQPDELGLGESSQRTHLKTQHFRGMADENNSCNY